MLLNIEERPPGPEGTSESVPRDYVDMTDRARVV